MYRCRLFRQCISRCRYRCRLRRWCKGVGICVGVGYVGSV